MFHFTIMPPILPHLRQIISEQVIPLHDAFGDDSDLYQEGLDSMALMQLILQLEQGFDIRLDASDLGRENFQSLRSIEQLIQKKQRL